VSIWGLIVLLVAGGLLIGWWRLLKGKELARSAAAGACRQHGLVLIDDTVMLDSIQLRREDPFNAWGFKYRFSFARAGLLHTGGVVLVAPGQRPLVVIDTDSGPLIEQL
jgi:hypothetical protein